MSEVFRTVDQEADWLQVSPKTVRRKAALLGGVRIGSKLLFPESETIRYLESERLGPRKGPRLRRVG